jgi:hypothetical protein
VGLLRPVQGLGGQHVRAGIEVGRHFSRQA